MAEPEADLREELARVRARLASLEAALPVGEALSLQQTAAALGISRYTFWRRMDELRALGLVELVPIARTRRFDKASVVRVRAAWAR